MAAGTSVSRVGGKTQAPALRDVSGTLRLDYAQFLELEMFTRFGGMSDTRVKRQIARGERQRALLSQPQYAPLRLADEVALLLALQAGVLDRITPEAVADLRAALPEWLDRHAGALVAQIETTRRLDAAGRIGLVAAMTGLAARHAAEASA